MTDSPSFCAGYWLGRQLPTVPPDPVYLPDTCRYDREEMLNGWRKAQQDVQAGVDGPSQPDPMATRVAALEAENALLTESLRMHVEALKNGNRIVSDLRFELADLQGKLDRARFLAQTGRADRIQEELSNGSD